MVFTQELKIAISILIGFAMIAFSIVASGASAHTLPIIGALFPSTSISPERADAGTRIVYGNKKAATRLVEFSDFQCPYCSQLHSTLKQLVDESNGKVQWEYRHFPLPIHPSALPAAHYAECVASLSGDASFWKYAETLMQNQSALSDTFLSASAQAVGVDPTKLQICLSDAKIQSHVSVDEQTAEAYGGTGTPFTIIIYPDNSTKAISGALPYEQWKSLLKT